MCLWGHFQRLDYEGSDLTNGLIPPWTEALFKLLGGGRTVESGA